jgi:3-methylcrotonyl-CoA carboxylase alpha subunit
MFNKILIANRGEIACRIIRTAKSLGIKTVAVFSQVDANAQHVQLADEAYCLGAAQVSESYLNQGKILAIAQRSQAQAIHPGYGFFSENTQFAQACEANHICFIGPPINAIAAMASKHQAKALMAEHQVPILPGYHGEAQDEATLLREAKSIGMPLLIKASSGGGGKGMQLVFTEDELLPAIKSAKRIAKANFGDDHILLEKYLENPRHIEVQVFADQHGNFVHLWERDCSIQRRYQKIIEESPADIPQDLREAMANAAINAARAINYQGAGTIEFLVDNQQQFYFMEMNTRLQVEHPVTEMITGVDLVAWQILVAAGETLPLKQQQIPRHGHAIEVRIYAEDPEQDFLPATGKIAYLQTPTIDAQTRIDSGVNQSDTISSYYDPMLAKLICHAQTRQQAIQKMQSALAQFHIVGVSNNLAYLRQLLSLADFASNHISINFIQVQQENLRRLQQRVLSPAILFSAALYNYYQQSVMQGEHSPWSQRDNWQMNLPAKQTFVFEHQQQKHILELNVLNNKQFTITYAKQTHTIHMLQHDKTQLSFLLDEVRCEARVISYQEHLYIIYQGELTQLMPYDISHAHHYDAIADNHLLAPMPGKIIEVMVEPGTHVASGDHLLVLEAMKMEHTIKAPSAGTVTDVYFNKGAQVNEGDELIALELAE